MTTRNALAAAVDFEETQLAYRQERLDIAKRALYGYDLAEFERANGIAVGDKLLISLRLIKLLRHYGWAEFIIEPWTIGKEIKIEGIDPYHSDVAVGGGVMTGTCGNVPIDMVKEMRAAWLAQHEVTT